MPLSQERRCHSRAALRASPQDSSRLGHPFLVPITVRQAQQEPAKQPFILLNKLEHCRAAGFEALPR